MAAASKLVFRWMIAAALGAASAAPGTAAAVDPFEIQVYDGTANAPGVLGLELHANAVARGIRAARPPELSPDHQSHFTLEPSFGVTPFLEVGAYLQTALLADGSFSYAGTKLRAKVVAPEAPGRHFRYGVNVELSLVPEAYDVARWGTELRPIAAFEDARWRLSVNPILAFPLAGPEPSVGPSLEPALMVKLKIRDAVALGLEYYADLGPVAHLAALKDEEHYLYEAFDLLAVDRLELNVAVGEGLTGASNPLVIKLIAGYTWEPQGERPRAGPSGTAAPRRVRARARAAGAG